VSYFLSKFLPLFLLPPGCFFLLIGISFLVYKWRVSWGKFLFVAAILILYISSMPMFSSYLLKSWENKVNSAEIQKLQLHQHDTRVAVVLGGIFKSTGRKDQPYLLNDSSDRLFMAIKMVKQRHVERVIFTGGGVPFNEERLPEASLMKQFVNEFDLLADTLLWIENKSVNTYQNALYTKQLLHERMPGQPINIFLITSAMHMPRAAYIFRQYGFGVTPVPTDYQTSDMDTFPLILQFVPRAGALFTTSKVMREWMGFNYYKLKFWVNGF